MPRARARERVVPISELVFGALTQTRSSLEPSLEFAAITRHGPPRASDRFSHVDTRRLPEARWQRRVVVRPQDYSGFGLKPQKPTPKSAQLASRAPVRAAWAQDAAKYLLCTASLTTPAVNRPAVS